MKPLTKKDRRVGVKEHIYDEEDVLSAVALLKRHIIKAREDFRISCDLSDINYLNKLIDECFQIRIPKVLDKCTKAKGQGTAKGIDLTAKLSGNPDLNPEDVGANPTSSQESPAHNTNKEAGK